MQPDRDPTLSNEATLAGAVKARLAAEMSLGDDRTLGNSRSGQDTIVDDIDVVDLEARYKTEGTLGRGGMGIVLLATDKRLERKVAIKQILGESVRSKTAISRFLTEAKAIAALNHPNIVQIYDSGRAKDGPFLIMEYVDGGSLLDRCRQAALPLDQAIDLACQLCDGLAKAHDVGIIHRDIKPANVLLTKDGIPKLTDFGLAKVQASDHAQTMTGAVLGTPDFMPPEQRQDAALIDHRSDLWSLAATVYQMVTGRSPKILRFDLLPAELTRVLGKALEDEKEHRFQSAREMREAIRTGDRAASPAPADEDLTEGMCPACKVKNDLNRKFCKGCAEPLRAPCLKCDDSMAMWDEICGSCGARQQPLVDDRQQVLAIRRAQAEGLLGDFDFDGATDVATDLRQETHPRLTGLTAWIESFLARVEEVRLKQTEHVAKAVIEAAEHEAEFDDLAAIGALETIPERLRLVQFPQAPEPACSAIERVRARQKEADRLEAIIQSSIATERYSDLLPTIDAFLAIRPGRNDIRTVRDQVVRWQHEQHQAARANALALIMKAAQHEARFEDIAAITTLESVAEPWREFVFSETGETASAALRRVQDRQDLARNLEATIKSKFAAKAYLELLSDLEHFLAIRPGREDAAKIRDQILTWQSKHQNVLREAIATAKESMEQGDTVTAAQALERVTAEFRTEEWRAVKDQVIALQKENLMREAITAAKAAIAQSDAVATFAALERVPSGLHTEEWVSLKDQAIALQKDQRRIMQHAADLVRERRFDEAVAMLMEARASQQSGEIRKYRDWVQKIAAWRQTAMNGAARANPGKPHLYKMVLGQCRDYEAARLKAGIVDPEFERAFKRVEFERKEIQAKRHQRVKSQATMRVAWPVIVIIGLILLKTIRFWGPRIIGH